MVRGHSNSDGEPDSVIRGTGDERLVNFQQDDITFRGFEVRGDNVITPKAECVDIKEAASFNTVEDNQCSGSRDPDGAGFSSRGEHNAFIGNVSTGNRGDGIRLGGDGKTQGLHNDVIGNTLSDNRGFGLDVERSPRERCAEIRQPATARGSSTGATIRPFPVERGRGADPPLNDRSVE